MAEHEHAYTQRSNEDTKSFVLPLISPKLPEPMANSLSFQSLDNSLSILGASGGEGETERERITTGRQHHNIAHLKSICCNKGPSL